MVQIQAYKKDFSTVNNCDWIDVLNSITESESEDDVIFLQNNDDLTTESSIHRGRNCGRDEILIQVPQTSFFDFDEIDEVFSTSECVFGRNNEEEFDNRCDSEGTSYISKRESYIQFKVQVADIANPDKSGTRTSTPRRVNFSTVHVRVYSITVGDHPMVSMYPISLDWSYNDSETISLNDEDIHYEMSHRGYKKAFRKVFRLQPHDRLSRILEVTGKDSTEIEMLECNRQNQLRKERSNSILQRALPMVKKITIQPPKIHHHLRLPLYHREYHMINC